MCGNNFLMQYWNQLSALREGKNPPIFRIPEDQISTPTYAPYLAEARRLIGMTSRVKLLEGAAEKLPFAETSLDLVVSSFLLHELPAEIRGKALAEMARVLRPNGLVVAVDSIQRGDHAAWDGLLDLFPHYFHEPYYADYVGSRLEDAGADLGLSLVSTERAFLSKVVAWQK